MACERLTLDLPSIELLLDAATDAAKYDIKYRLGRRLRLGRLEDIILMNCYLQQRFLRANIYDTTSLLNDPRTAILAKLPLFNRLVKFTDNKDRADREELKKLSDATNGFYQLMYPTLEDKTRARTIELAVNDLFSKAIPGNVDEYKSIKKRFKPSLELLENWEQRWQKQLL